MKNGIGKKSWQLSKLGRIPSLCSGRIVILATGEPICFIAVRDRFAKNQVVLTVRFVSDCDTVRWTRIDSSPYENFNATVFVVHEVIRIR